MAATLAAYAPKAGQAPANNFFPFFLVKYLLEWDCKSGTHSTFLQCVQSGVLLSPGVKSGHQKFCI